MEAVPGTKQGDKSATPVPNSRTDSELRSWFKKRSWSYSALRSQALLDAHRHTHGHTNTVASTHAHAFAHAYTVVKLEEM